MAIEDIATKLQALLERRLGMKVPIFNRVPATSHPAIVLTFESWGDPYSGGYLVDTLTLEGAGELHVHFRLVEHDLSGQCDYWQLEVRGADAADRDAFAKAFHPRERTGHWGNHATITYTFNGVEGSF